MMEYTHTDIFTVPPKAQGRYKKGAAKPESGRVVEAPIDPLEMLRAGEEEVARLKQGRPKIDKHNSIPKFKQLIQRLDEVDDDKGIEEATKEMGDVVRSLIKESMGDKNYDRAIENIGVLRETCIGLEVPDLYNNFLRDLKKKIFSDALGTGRKEMWGKLRLSGKLGLITKSESEVSNITEEEAKQVRTASFPNSHLCKKADVSCFHSFGQRTINSSADDAPSREQGNVRLCCRM